MVRGAMRLTLSLLLVLGGCVGFHPMTTSRPGGGRSEPYSTEGARDDVRLQWQSVGTTTQGRPLRMTRLGRGPRRVLWVGGIHGNEREGRVATAELPRALAAVPGALEAVTLTILEDCNPDGTARNTRGNARGVDLNRNYPATNFQPSRLFGLRPLDQPEARALHDLILDERPHLVIVAHSWHDDHFINFDGPAEDLARRFSARSGYRVKPSDSFAATPGSLGSWVGRGLGLPILTLEYPRGHEPWAAWHETRAAILDVVLSG